MIVGVAKIFFLYKVSSTDWAITCDLGLNIAGLLILRSLCITGSRFFCFWLSSFFPSVFGPLWCGLGLSEEETLCVRLITTLTRNAPLLWICRVRKIIITCLLIMRKNNKLPTWYQYWKTSTHPMTIFTKIQTFQLVLPIFRTKKETSHHSNDTSSSLRILVELNYFEEKSWCPCSTIFFILVHWTPLFMIHWK